MVNKDLSLQIELVSHIGVYLKVFLVYSVGIGSAEEVYHATLVPLLGSRCQVRVNNFSTNTKLTINKNLLYSLAGYSGI